MMKWKDKVCIIGSGNWGSAISIMIGNNCVSHSELYHEEVHMWVFEEMVDGEKLSSIINEKHENVKYLPGIQLPQNVIAEPNLSTACRNATLLIFVLPHQFLNKKLFATIRASMHPTQCRAISLIKGIDFDTNTKLPILISKTIEHNLSTAASSNNNFQCGVLMGANVAADVAQQQLVCESTLACDFDEEDDDDDVAPPTADNHHIHINERTRLLFHNDVSFRVQHLPSNVHNVEVCGALKNVIALGAGFIDGIGGSIGNTKAALIRIGLLEIMKFCHLFFPKHNIDSSSFSFILQSCGVADLITTCYNGRNRKCAQEFAMQRQQQQQHGDTMTAAALPAWCDHAWNQIETTLLKGQKLQGTITCKEVYTLLSAKKLLSQFPLINTIYEIAFLGKPIHTITNGIKEVQERTRRASKL